MGFQSVRINKPGDPRFRLVGKQLGIDWRHAMGICVELYSYCTDEQTYSLRVDLLDAIAEIEGFASALIHSDLAEKLENGTVCLKKLPFGGIEWLGDRRSAGKKGGEQRQKEAVKNEEGRFEPGNVQANTKQTPSKEQADASLSISISSSSYIENLRTKTKEADPPSALPAVQEARAPDPILLFPEKLKKPKPNIAPLIATYVKAWQSRYDTKGRPGIEPAYGIFPKLLKTRSAEEIHALLQVYCQMSDPWFLTKRHDLGTFGANVENVVLAMDKGIESTSTNWNRVFGGAKGGETDLFETDRADEEDLGGEELSRGTPGTFLERF